MLTYFTYLNYDANREYNNRIEEQLKEQAACSFKPKIRERSRELAKRRGRGVMPARTVSAPQALRATALGDVGRVPRARIRQGAATRRAQTVAPARTQPQVERRPMGQAQWKLENVKCMRPVPLSMMPDNMLHVLERKHHVGQFALAVGTPSVITSLTLQV